MANTSKGKKGAGGPASFDALLGGLDLARAGMPAVDSIVGVRTVQAPADAASLAEGAAPFSFRIIKTREVDGYEEDALPFGIMAPAKKAAKKTAKKPAKKAAKKISPDAFDGSSRKAAKLSISAAPLRSYKDLRNLFRTLPTDAEMANRQPRIGTGETSGRVPEEERNVRVQTFLYAASREDDRDFHLILGRHPGRTPELYMTMELSGLPPEDSPAFARLKAARDAYKAFFANDLPGTSYDFYDPPIPVTVEGSLYWDASHAKGTRPGPQSLKSRMPTIWEVHPITKITFNP